ncbi:MAG: alpha/beta fold hydrolase [Saprospiraceae bacterium]|nr:alpha/beta fold hydrolase [Saprospiraceae bacterium]MCB9343852.1 alpha/beta fold hydrolase [Lewinellaceae bacterium]
MFNIKRYTVKIQRRIVRMFLSVSPIVFKGMFATAQGAPFPGQPDSGPGGADYTHQSVLFFDVATTADGYWLFEPADPKPDSAEVVVFLHGYGAYNPMAYGKWIKHLVAKGNIVIYPRYQKNLLWPRPNGFPKNAAKGIRDAIDLLQQADHVSPKIEKVVYIAHSYGGVIATNLAANWEKYKVPKPAGMLLAEPGSGPFKGARLENYAGLPSDMNLEIVVGEDDYVVGSEFGRLVFETAVNTPRRNLVLQRRDTSGHKRWVLATHSEPYAYDLDFDTGLRNYTAQRVLLTSRLNEVDFFCYWKFSDALIDYSRKGICEEYVFGDTPEQRFLGYWPDGRPIKEMKVFTPEYLEELGRKRQVKTQEEVVK